MVKDKTARRLMLQMSKPGKKGQKYHETDPQKLKDLELYCVRDVEAERALGEKIPILSDAEKKVSLVSMLTNLKGAVLDEAAIGTLILNRETVRRATEKEVGILTRGAVHKVESEVAALQAWLKTEGVHLASVDKEGVAEALANGIAGRPRRVLELRQQASKSSLGKLDRMLAVMGADKRARGLLQYYGASRTGRWAGRAIQPQNLPRVPKGFDMDRLLGTVRTDTGGLSLFYEKPLEALSACLRGCITAPPGRLLAMIDLSQIEARVLAWLAGQDDILRVFADPKKDAYVEEARKAGSTDRQLGKVLVLACGYGMGASRFQETAATYGVIVTLEEAGRLVRAWRGNNQQTVRFWYAVEDAFREAMDYPGRIVQTRGLRFRLYRGALHIQKPNKEVLVYHKPFLKDGTIWFWGVNQTTKRWCEQHTYGGKLVENITQSVARDIMAEATVRIYEAGANMVPIMTIHDEVVYEVQTQIAATLLQGLVNTVPAWAAGLPLASSLNVGFRYGK
jgi:DNA polymerase